ncbi:hypothetical protein RUND412_008735 [Rhizina undulata]
MSTLARAQPYPTRKILEPGTRFKHVRVRDLLDKEEMRRAEERREAKVLVRKGKAKAKVKAIKKRVSQMTDAEKV